MEKLDKRLLQFPRTKDLHSSHATSLLARLGISPAAEIFTRPHASQTVASAVSDTQTSYTRVCLVFIFKPMFSLFPFHSLRSIAAAGPAHPPRSLSLSSLFFSSGSRKRERERQRAREGPTAAWRLRVSVQVWSKKVFWAQICHKEAAPACFFASSDLLPHA